MDFEQAMSEKNAVTTRLNGKNYATIAGTGVDIIDATARFVSNKVIEIQAGEEKEELTAETIIINTGAVPTILPIPGLAESKFAVDSTGIQRLEICQNAWVFLAVDQSDWNLPSLQYLG